MNGESVLTTASLPFLENIEHVASDRGHEDVDEHDDDDGSTHIDEPIASVVSVLSVKYVVPQDRDLSEIRSNKGLC